jgi:hypothetical protein
MPLLPCGVQHPRAEEDKAEMPKMQREGGLMACVYCNRGTKPICHACDDYMKSEETKLRWAAYWLKEEAVKLGEMV